MVMLKILLLLCFIPVRLNAHSVDLEPSNILLRKSLKLITQMQFSGDVIIAKHQNDENNKINNLDLLFYVPSYNSYYLCPVVVNQYSDSNNKDRNKDQLKVILKFPRSGDDGIHMTWTGSLNIDVLESTVYPTPLKTGWQLSSAETQNYNFINHRNFDCTDNLSSEHEEITTKFLQNSVKTELNNFNPDYDFLQITSISLAEIKNLRSRNDESEKKHMTYLKKKYELNYKIYKQKNSSILSHIEQLALLQQITQNEAYKYQAKVKKHDRSIDNTFLLNLPKFN